MTSRLISAKRKIQYSLYFPKSASQTSFSHNIKGIEKDFHEWFQSDKRDPDDFIIKLEERFGKIE